MTTRDAIKRVKAHFGKKSDMVDDTAVLALLWDATDEFARETCVTIKHHDITITGAATYSVNPDRIRRVFDFAVNVSGTTEWPMRLVPVQELRMSNTAPSLMSGSPATSFAYTEDGQVAIYPLGTTGDTLRILVSKTPIMQDRGSASVDGETCTTGGTTTSVPFTSLSGGKVANNATASDYYEDCIVLFGAATTTVALRNQRGRISNYNESAGTFTVSTLAAAPASGDVFTILDVLEINELYAPLCVVYAAGMTAMSLEGFRALGETLLAKYERRLVDARKKKPGVATERSVGRLGIREDIWD